MNKLSKNQAGFGKMGIIIAVVVVAVAVALFFGLRAGEKEPIKIGAILSLTGSGSHLADLRDAMLLCIFDISPSSKSKSRYKVRHKATGATQRVFRTSVRG